MNVLYFDTETTGLPKASKPYNHPEQPHITQLGFIHEVNGHDAMVVDTLIKPDNWPIQKDSGTGIGQIASDLTGITQDMCEESGIPIADAVEMFILAAENSDFIVCHNVAFDTKLIGMEYNRLRPEVSPKTVLCGRPTICTMLAATPVCRLPKGDGKGSGHKWPKLIEAMQFFFNEGLDGAHSAIIDIIATRRVFHKLGGLGYLDDQLIKGGLDPETVKWLDIPTAADKRDALCLLIEEHAPREFCDRTGLPAGSDVEMLADMLIAGGLLK